MIFPKMRELRSEKLIKKIVEKYPWILNNCIEVFVPDTWHGIVLDSIERIKSSVEKYYGNNMFGKEVIGISQIKEKFGLIRIYVDFPEKDDFYSEEFKSEIFKTLDNAEFESGNICSVCGSRQDISGQLQDEKCYHPPKCKSCSGKPSAVEIGYVQETT